jgi:hypothetical protein
MVKKKFAGKFRPVNCGQNFKNENFSSNSEMTGELRTLQTLETCSALFFVQRRSKNEKKTALAAKIKCWT